MNLLTSLAFFVYHSAKGGPADLVINFFIYILAAIIIILLLRKFATELGLDAAWLKIISLIILLLVVVALFTGCATNTGDPIKDRRGRITNAVGEDIFNAVLSFGITEGQQALSGQKGQNASMAAFNAATSLISTDSFERVIRAAAGPQVAMVAKNELIVANPQTPQEKAFVMNTIGAALQTATNQNAK